MDRIMIIRRALELKQSTETYVSARWEEISRKGSKGKGRKEDFLSADALRATKIILEEKRRNSDRRN
jgi:hypothetical protein